MAGGYQDTPGAQYVPPGAQFIPVEAQAGLEVGGIALSVSSKHFHSEIDARVNQEEEPLLLHQKHDVQDNKFPTSIWFIMSNEICERFSFYGLRAILFLYLSKHLLLGDDTATVVVHAFTMGAYATAILGGYLSDAVLGKYKTILYVSMLYCVGSATLAVTAIPGLLGDPPHWSGVAVGLTLVALGTGGIKPVVSAFVGDQFTPAQGHLLERVFRLFYFCINLGSVFSTILTPIIRENFNYAYAFGLPAVLLVVATGIFYSGKTKYRTYAPTGSVLRDTVKLIYAALSIRIKHGRSSIPKGVSFLYLCEGRFSTTLIQDVAAALQVLLVFVPLPFFWALFDQHASRWISQADLMGLNLDLKFVTIKLTADQIPALDPILVLILVPIFDLVIYPGITRYRPFPPLLRMAFGMILTSAAFVLAGFLQLLIDERGSEDKVPIYMQVPQYFLLASGEIMVSVTGLEYAYTQAPRTMKSIIMSGWLLTVSIGNLIVMIVAESSPLRPAYEFFFFSVLMIVAMFLFLFIVYHSRLDELKQKVLVCFKSKR